MPKILTLDIETAPLETYNWGLWEQNIGVNQIAVEWTILSYAAKWLDKPTVIYKDTGGRGKGKVRDDKELMQSLWELLDQADIVVTQNGREFDLKKINARMLIHGLKPYAPVRIIDTKIVAKKHFGFTSNRLEWMSKHLTDTFKQTHKKFPGFELWLECLKDNPAAWAEMRKYNKVDVIATEKLYLKLRPWIDGHPNLATYTDSAEVHCPKCNSRNVQRRGTTCTQAGKYTRYQCVSCGGWSKSKHTHLDAGKRNVLLGN